MTYIYVTKGLRHNTGSSKAYAQYQPAWLSGYPTHANRVAPSQEKD
jgi:hypothetical protein